MALKCMSYINSDLLILPKKLPQASHSIQSGINQAWKAGSWQRDELYQFKPNQQHIATHIFSKLAARFPFLHSQGYENLLQASAFDFNFAT